MTLPNTPNVKRHTGNGTTGPWDYPYYYADENDIEFSYRLANGTEGVFDPATDYTRISGGPGDPLGSVYQTTNAVAADTKLAIQAKTPAQQTTTPDEINRFRAQEFEVAFDRQALTTRRHEDDIERAIVSSPIDPKGDKIVKGMKAGFLLKVESVTDDGQGGEIVVIDGGTAQQEDVSNPANFVRRDGTQPPTADQPFANFKATGMADPTNPQDGATKSFVEAADATVTAHIDQSIINQADYLDLAAALADLRVKDNFLVGNDNGKFFANKNMILLTSTDGTTETHDGAFVVGSDSLGSQANGAVVVGYGTNHPTWPGLLFLSAVTEANQGRIFSENEHKFRRSAVFNGRWKQTPGGYDYLQCPDADGQVHIFGDFGTLGTDNPEIPGFTASSDGDHLVIEQNGTADAGMTIATLNTQIGNIFFADAESTVAGRIAYQHSVERMFFSTGTTAHFYIEGAAGNMGMGTTPLSSRRLVIQGTGSTSATYSLDIKNSAATTLLQIRDDSLMYAPPVYLQTTGGGANVNVASNGLLARSTSALKYKDDLQPVASDAVEAFMAMDGFTYRSNIETDDQSQRYYGFAADDADERGLKELVDYGDDGEVEGFDYGRALVLLHAEIKRLREEVAQLSAPSASM